jgi:hypothetical protein
MNQDDQSKENEKPYSMQQPVARESKAQTYPAPVHHYLRHRCAAVPRHGHLPIAARVKRTWRREAPTLPSDDPRA